MIGVLPYRGSFLVCPVVFSSHYTLQAPTAAHAYDGAVEESLWDGTLLDE